MKENENLLMSPLWVLYNKGVQIQLNLKVAEQIKDIFKRMFRTTRVNFNNEVIYELQSLYGK